MSPRTELIQLCLHPAHLSQIVDVSSGTLGIDPHLRPQLSVDVLIQKAPDDLIE
jgi:hypothetical protein